MAVTLRSLFRRKKEVSEFHSDAYWRDRYEAGGNSGAGSYGRLAEYKAGFINDLVKTHEVQSVIEFGSGDGNQCSLLTIENYTGVDISPAVVTACRKRFAGRENWQFLTDAEYQVNPAQADMSMSLDVIYHLVEDAIFERYMETLFSASRRFVLVYSSDTDTPSRATHVRHRSYSNWIAAHAPAFALVEAFEQPYPMRPGSDPRTTSFASFKLFARPCDTLSEGKP
ncbi:class I SAM-dependent methyltransferase [Rhodobacter sp. SY28-1]|uniref:class I SAM-dependent methyltransferase n=1 Tax=Rhodobacter sp. SY28-1 TaxID=2562317 RepID=UPI0010BFE7A8|nr:class I SAM-dependent methyltransferase [Rhodobacter sp. SY28-1]